MAIARRPLGLALAAALAWPAAAGAQTADAPEVALVTIGPGDDVFSRFGHAALCVRDPVSPQGRCYNYGTANFSTFGTLLWSVLRGTARFWVSVVDEPAMVLQYGRNEDRSVWRQVLPYPPEARRALVARLAHDALPANREYVYNHYRDNCTTRLRDHLDAVSDHSLASTRATATTRTWRDRTREGLAGDLRLLGLVELLLGRRADEVMSRWDEMFLPAVLREEVQRVTGAAPVTLATRTKPLPEGAPDRGLGLLGAVSASLAALGFGAGQRRVRPLALASRVLLVAVLTVLGLLVWAMAATSTLPELRGNLMVLVFAPTDFLLGRPSMWSRYAPVRLVGLVLVIAAWTVGWFEQVSVGIMAVGVLLAVAAFARPDETLPPTW